MKPTQTIEWTGTKLNPPGQSQITFLLESITVAADQMGRAADAAQVVVRGPACALDGDTLALRWSTDTPGEAADVLRKLAVAIFRDQPCPFHAIGARASRPSQALPESESGDGEARPAIFQWVVKLEDFDKGDTEAKLKAMVHHLTIDYHDELARIKFPRTATILAVYGADAGSYDGGKYACLQLRQEPATFRHGDRVGINHDGRVINGTVHALFYAKTVMGKPIGPGMLVEFDAPTNGNIIAAGDIIGPSVPAAASANYALPEFSEPVATAPVVTKVVEEVTPPLTHHVFNPVEMTSQIDTEAIAPVLPALAPGDSLKEPVAFDTSNMKLAPPPGLAGITPLRPLLDPTDPNYQKALATLRENIATGGPMTQSLAKFAGDAIGKPVPHGSEYVTPSEEAKAVSDQEITDTPPAGEPCTTTFDGVAITRNLSVLVCVPGAEPVAGVVMAGPRGKVIDANGQVRVKTDDGRSDKYDPQALTSNPE